MTISDGVIEGESITFLLSDTMSLGSIPLLALLIRQATRLGLSVTLDLGKVTEIDEMVASQLSAWAMQGVTLSSAPSFVRRWMTEGAHDDPSIRTTSN
jgi:hypothetical protein